MKLNVLPGIVFVFCLLVVAVPSDTQMKDDNTFEQIMKGVDAGRGGYRDYN